MCTEYPIKNTFFHFGFFPPCFENWTKFEMPPPAPLRRLFGRLITTFYKYVERRRDVIDYSCLQIPYNVDGREDEQTRKFWRSNRGKNKTVDISSTKTAFTENSTICPGQSFHPRGIRRGWRKFSDLTVSVGGLQQDRTWLPKACQIIKSMEKGPL